MKVLLTFASIVGLAAALGTARAQTPATPPAKPSAAKAIATKTADKRAATYKGPKVVNDTKALGKKMLRDSKPALKPVDPVKQ